MALFGRKSRDTDNGGVRATALVVEASAPAEGGAWGGNLGTVRVLVDAGSGPVSVSRTFKLDKDRWLVAGMEVPVAIDPNQADQFELDWEAIPSIEDRVAANDPTLADPVGARRKVVEALKAAGLGGPDPSTATPDRVREAIERAAQEPAPPGKARAVVLIATIRGRVDMDHHKQVRIEGKCPAVLAVNVPGRAPYAVFERRFEVPRGQWDVAGAGLPALVSSSDPSDVEVLWDELPSLGSQIGQRISEGMRESNEMERQLTDALQQAGADPPAAIPAPGGAAMQALSPEMREMMARNAKLGLQFVKDPAQRQMLIEQYRAAGIPVDEADEAP